MAEASYIWIGKDDQAELLGHEEVIRRAERGQKPKSIFRVAQEMELRFQLVPRKRIDKAKRTVAAEAERAAARRGRLRPVAIEQAIAETYDNPDAPQTAPARTRRSRTRLPKAVGER